MIDAKRGMDLAITVPVLLLTLPIQAVAAITIRRSMGRPVLFRQQRPGLHGEPFEMVKFRTMLLPNPAQGIVTDEQRMTRVGAVLRSTSIDELPTLWNVVRGDMSLVGPRPLLMQYLDRYTAEQARRHEVRPGLTGLAQVNGRNAISWDQRLEYDVDYVKTRTVLMDVKILLRTVRKVLRRDGISADGHVTMAEFMGSAS